MTYSLPGLIGMEKKKFFFSEKLKANCQNIKIIERACSPSRFDPNLAVNLEVCETINKKQGNA